MSRLELPAGQWAELRDRLTYAQARELRLAYFHAQADPMAQADYDLTVVRVFVTSWHVQDFEGHPLALEQPELAPDAVIQAIFAAGVELVPGAMGVPKAGGETSPTSPPAPESANGMTTYAMSSSLPTTPAGPTET